MPIYEFACPRCRVIFNFLSKRINPDRRPTCPKCGHRNMAKQMSAFATLHGLKAPSATSPAEPGAEPGMPDLDDPKVLRVMSEMERDLAHLDENNPRHMAYMMRKMKDVLPANAMPRELDQAINRLEAGEDPEKVEADMGEAFGDFMGGPDEESGGGGYGGGYAKDSGLYDY